MSNRTIPSKKLSLPVCEQRPSAYAGPSLDEVIALIKASPAPAEAKTAVPLLKMRKCPVKRDGCGQAFRPMRQGQIACLDCAVPVGKWLKASKDKAAHREDIKQTKAKG